MRETGLPFDDIRNLLKDLPPRNEDIAEHVGKQLQELGVYETDKVYKICTWYAAWSGRSPTVHRGLVTLFAGTHMLDDAMSDGNAGASVLAKVTELASGASTLNGICQTSGFGLKVFDLALQIPVSDISEEAALDEKSCAGTIGFGMEAIAGGTDLLCIAAVEPQVSLSSFAILAVLYPELEAIVLAKVPSEQQSKLAAAVEQAKGHKDNPLEVLRRLGGRENAALCGAILSARTEHVPVVLDSVAGIASAAVLHAVNPLSISHCLFGQMRDVLPHDLVGTIGIDPLLPEGASADPVNGVAISGGLVRSICAALTARR